MQVTQRQQRVALAVGAIVALVMVLLGVFHHSPAEPSKAVAAPAATPTPKPKPRPSCTQSGGAFVPSSASIDGIGTVGVVPAWPLPGDAAGTPPETQTGKRQMAWNAPGPKPNGSTHGAVVTDAHSWPDNSALGNTFMTKLKVGAILKLTGPGGTACYRIVSRTIYDIYDVPGSAYSTDGPARLTITICYWPRLGPGNWRNRMIWVATPVHHAVMHL